MLICFQESLKQNGYRYMMGDKVGVAMGEWGNQGSLSLSISLSWDCSSKLVMVVPLVQFEDADVSNGKLHLRGSAGWSK